MMMIIMVKSYRLDGVLMTPLLPAEGPMRVMMIVAKTTTMMLIITKEERQSGVMSKDVENDTLAADGQADG